MGGHESPCKLVPSFGIKGYEFHDRFHGLWEFRFELETESFLVSWLFDVIIMLGTGLVHVVKGQ